MNQDALPPMGSHAVKALADQLTGPAAMLLAQAQVGLMVIGRSGLLYANEAALRMFQAEVQDIADFDLMDCVSDVDRAQVGEQLHRRLQGEAGYLWDVRCRRRDGSTFVARIFGQPVDVAGESADLVTLTDISETQAALRQAEWAADMLARSESLSRSGSFEIQWPEGTVRASSGLVALVGACALSCSQRPESVDQLPWVPAEDRERVAAAWRAARPDEAFELQHRLRTCEGEELQVIHRGVLQTRTDLPGGLMGVGFVQDITQQQEAERRIQELANYDEVTGLPNRSYFLSQVELRTQIARWDKRGFSLMAVEVPQVAELRSKLGFGAGDALAMTLAARLSRLVREHEMVAHMGGTEFAFLTALHEEAQSAGAVDAIRQRARDLQCELQTAVHVGAAEVFPQCRIGVAMFPADGGGATALLEAAETACLAAEAAGGIAFARPEANAAAVREMQMASALRHAIGRDELYVVYQPQVDLEHGVIVGAEALLRWRSSAWGEVPPVEFIPVAERSGLIGEIGHWVLTQVCLQNAAWRQKGLPSIRLAVNVSPLQLRHGDFAGEVQRVLLETGADPRGLGIEITESALMDSPEQAATMLEQLKSLGIEISLDDFGTGFSSLSALRRLPIDVVKVDRSFIHDITATSEGVSVTRAIITMARGLQMKVLAEGVETENQLSLLVARGCDQIQGYWFSRPVLVEALEEMLRTGKRLPDGLTRRRQRVRTLLLVDDEENILAALKRLFRRDGYRVLAAPNPLEALELLKQHDVDVILSDQRMPGMTGVQFLHEAQRLYPDTVRMTLSGFTDLQSIIDAVNEGAISKFLTKPWDDERLRAHVAEAFRRKELADENRRLSEEVAGTNAELASVNSRLSAALARQREQAMLLQASAGGVRDILDELPLAVLGIDPDGLLVYANCRAQSFFRPPDLVLGLPVGPLVTDLLDRLDQRDDCDRRAPPETVEINGVTCTLWSRPLLNEAGQPRGQVLLCLTETLVACHEPV